MKALVHGQRTLLCEFRVGKGGMIPWHKHPHEQTGYLVEGKMTLNTEQGTCELEPGDAWCISGDELHSAEILEDALLVEVFSPVRQDYLR